MYHLYIIFIFLNVSSYINIFFVYLILTYQTMLYFAHIDYFFIDVFLALSIVSDNGLLSIRHQAIIWTKDGFIDLTGQLWPKLGKPNHVVSRREL